MTSAPRSAFGAEFVGAAGFLNSPTYGLPPTFLLEGLTARIGEWQAGTMDVPSFDASVRHGRAAYAALVGASVESVTMGGSVSALLGLVAAAVPDGARVATLAGEFASAEEPCFSAHCPWALPSVWTTWPSRRSVPERMYTSAADSQIPIKATPGAFGAPRPRRH